MVSLTRHTKNRREIRKKTAGRIAAKARAQKGTPAFPVHPEGYDPKAPDAQPSPASAKKESK